MSGKQPAPTAPAAEVLARRIQAAYPDDMLALTVSALLVRQAHTLDLQVKMAATTDSLTGVVESLFRRLKALEASNG